MEREKLRQRYREFDRDCARLSRYQWTEEERKGLFLPMGEEMELVWIGSFPS